MSWKYFMTKRAIRFGISCTSKGDTMTKREQLYYLLEAFKRGEYDIPTFCIAYEHVFYPDIPYDELTHSELAVFEALGEVVDWFSPYEDDLKAHPKSFHTLPFCSRYSSI